MERKKEGAEKSAPKKNQSHYNKITNVCLALGFIGMVLTILGKYIQNDRVMMTGVGMMITVMILQSVINEEDEDV